MVLMGPLPEKLKIVSQILLLLHFKKVFVAYYYRKVLTMLSKSVSFMMPIILSLHCKLWLRKVTQVEVQPSF